MIQELGRLLRDVGGTEDNRRFGGVDFNLWAGWEERCQGLLDVWGICRTVTVGCDVRVVAASWKREALGCVALFYCRYSKTGLQAICRCSRIFLWDWSCEICGRLGTVIAFRGNLKS
jgi:hypothetical protein